LGLITEKLSVCTFNLPDPGTMYLLYPPLAGPIHTGVELQDGELHRPGVSNSTCAVDHMRTYKVTRGPRYNADTTAAVPELTRKSFCIFISCKRYHEL